jgi:D-3-phosphoglycerate dehydrogenase
MSKPFIVVSDGMDSSIFEGLKNNPNLDVHPSPKITQDELKELLPKVEGLIIRSATKPNKEMMDAAPNLKYIIRAGEGTDNIDKAYAQERNIKVSNTPGANNNSAAEHALAMMMTVLRKTASANSSMQTGAWDKAAFTGNELWNKTVGIIGFGRIGQLLCKRLQGFEPKVLFFDPGVDESPFEWATKVNSVEELVKEADVVSIHTPLIPQTKDLFNKDLLALMKPNAILVNAARGGIVVEEDLVTALKQGLIAGAGLDVFGTEPLEGKTNLHGIENLVLTPHLGGSTEEAQFRVGEMAAHQINEFFIN